MQRIVNTLTVKGAHFEKLTITILQTGKCVITIAIDKEIASYKLISIAYC